MIEKIRAILDNGSLDERLRVLAELSFALTIAARSSYDTPEMSARLRAHNEIFHQLLGRIREIVIDRNDYLANGALLETVLEHADHEKISDEVAWALSQAAKVKGARVDI